MIFHGFMVSCHFMALLNTEFKSLIQSKKSGPNVDPWGTPHLTDSNLEEEPNTKINCWAK